MALADDTINYRNELFDAEQKRQREQVGRIEKIEVRYLGVPEDVTLIMNKGISTPYNCAQRMYKINDKFKCHYYLFINLIEINGFLNRFNGRSLHEIGIGVS